MSDLHYTNEQLDAMYEQSKHDDHSLVGSEVRCLIGDLREARRVLRIREEQIISAWNSFGAGQIVSDIEEADFMIGVADGDLDEQIVELTKQRDDAERNMKSRDDFLVSKDMFTEFTNWLPK